MDGACIAGRIAGCRGIIRDMYKECKGGFYNYPGICSSVRAGLWGILKGLSLGKNLGTPKVELNADSSLAIHMIKSGRVTDMEIEDV